MLVFARFMSRGGDTTKLSEWVVANAGAGAGVGLGTVADEAAVKLTFSMHFCATAMQPFERVLAMYCCHSSSAAVASSSPLLLLQ